MSLQPNTYAAPALRTKRNIPDPDKRLGNIIAKKPSATDLELARAFLKAASPEELEAALVYYVHNRRISIERYADTMEPDEYIKQRTERTFKAAEKVIAIRAAAKTIYLEHVMLNGKKLRDCTFREAGSFGGGFAKLAKMGKPDALVGTLSEAKVRAAFK